MENIQQGKFTSNGKAKAIELRGGVDWMEVYNANKAGASGTNQNVVFKWQRGMNDSNAIALGRAGDATDFNSRLLTSNGFTFTREYDEVLGDSVNVNSITAVKSPVVTTAANHNLQVGDIVRFYNTVDQLQTSSFDFEVITVNSDTEFVLPEFPNAPAAAAAGGSLRKVIYKNPFTPKRNLIINISKDQKAVVTTAAKHDWKVGMRIRINIGSERFGMTQIDQKLGTVIEVVGDRQVRTDIDTTSYGKFVYPNSINPRFSPTEGFAFAQNIEYSRANDLSDTTAKTENTGKYVMVLEADSTNPALSPAGANGDEIYWRAGTSFSVINE